VTQTFTGVQAFRDPADPLLGPERGKAERHGFVKTRRRYLHGVLHAVHISDRDPA